MVAAILLFIFLDFTVNRTKMGRGIRAVAQDQQMASLMGVNINRTIATTFAIGGVLGGAAGFLFAMSFGVSSTMGFIPALYAFTAAVLGGIGNVRGAMLGGIAARHRRDAPDLLAAPDLARGGHRLRHPHRDPHLPSHRHPRRAPRTDRMTTTERTGASGSRTSAASPRSSPEPRSAPTAACSRAASSVASCSPS